MKTGTGTGTITTLMFSSPAGEGTEEADRAAGGRRDK